MLKIKIANKLLLFFALSMLLFSACLTNPLTGQRTMAFVNNSELFPMAFEMYDDFIAENTVVTGTPDALMVERVGRRLADAAHRWLTIEGVPHYLDDYEWAFTLILDDTVNAWVLPGGKVVFYTGILPVTLNEAGLAAVMGHEIAHALLNHGQQRMSASLLQEIGALGISLTTAILIPEFHDMALLAYGIGSTLGGTLPFSRRNELEADEYGTILMAIAGYDPIEAVAFWERMMALSSGGSVPQFLSTHPSNASRIRNLERLVPAARQKATEFGVYF
ncbi:MAG: M48 family metallopeptidase [Treponema sp.]|nr:M48 family metallopeptidase [Treponema sp.]